MFSLSLVILTIASFQVDAAYEDKANTVIAAETADSCETKPIEISEKCVLEKVLLSSFFTLSFLYIVSGSELYLSYPVVNYFFKVLSFFLWENILLQ